MHIFVSNSWRLPSYPTGVPPPPLDPAADFRPPVVVFDSCGFDEFAVKILI